MDMQKEIWKHKGFEIVIERYNAGGSFDQYKYLIKDIENKQQFKSGKKGYLYVKDAKEDAEREINCFLEHIKDINNFKFDLGDNIRFKPAKNFVQFLNMRFTNEDLYPPYGTEYVSSIPYDIITKDNEQYVETSFATFLETLQEHGDYGYIGEIGDNFEIVKE